MERDYESVWRALEEWRERMTGNVALESVGAAWLCRLQAPLQGIDPVLCHGSDATTAVEGALAMLAAREQALTKGSGTKPNRHADLRSFSGSEDWTSQVLPKNRQAPGTLRAKSG